MPSRSTGAAAVSALVVGVLLAAPLGAQTAEERSSAMAWGAHHLCAGVFVVGRDFRRAPDVVLERDVRPFGWFRWEDAFGYEVDWSARRVTVSAPGLPARSAGYHGDQGCIIEPRGGGSAGAATTLAFEPRTIASSLPDPRTQPWPTGDLGAHAPLPESADADALNAALDRAMGPAGQNTRALVVLHRGHIVAERYAEGFGPHTPQISWSQGKSIAAALAGVLVQEGALSLDEPAPVAAWHADPEDPARRDPPARPPAHEQRARLPEPGAGRPSLVHLGQRALPALHGPGG